jgi:multiple sugar transport system substrate-binding protein
MQRFDRRRFIGTAATVAAALGAGWSQTAHADDLSFKPEAGAKLRVLRWKRFVEGDETAFQANIQKFTAQSGVQVHVDSEGWEDVRPKAAVAANVGSGPDLVAGWFDDPHQYPDKLVDLSDLAEYLGKK